MEFLPDVETVTKAVKFSNMGLSHFNSKWSKERDTKLFQETIHQMKKYQQDEIHEVRKTYIMSSFYDMERHFQQLNSDLIQGSKEFEKDMVDQRTLWCQTVILAGTIMILGLITVLVQGILPSEHTDDQGQFNDNFIATNLYLSYSVSNAGAMAFLFISIVIYIEIVHRISVFNHLRSSEHTGILKEAMKETRALLRKMRPADVESPRGDQNPLFQSDNFEYIYVPATGKCPPKSKKMSTSCAQKACCLPLTSIPEDLGAAAESKDAEISPIKPCADQTGSYSPVYEQHSAASLSDDSQNNYSLLPATQDDEMSACVGQGIEIRMSEAGRPFGERNISSSSLASFSDDDSKEQYDANTSPPAHYDSRGSINSSAAAPGSSPFGKWSYNVFGSGTKREDYQHKKDDTVSPLCTDRDSSNEKKTGSSFLASVFTLGEAAAASMMTRRSSKRVRRADSEDLLFPTSSNSYTKPADSATAHAKCDGNKRNKAPKRFSLLPGNIATTKRQPKYNTRPPMKRHGSSSSLPTRQTIATMDSATLDAEFKTHEHKVLNVFMAQRDEINTLTATIYDEEHSFEHYWNFYCSQLNTFGVICFYIGSALMYEIELNLFYRLHP